MKAEKDIVGPVPDGRDPDDYDRQRRRVLWAMPAGLYVVGSRAGGTRNLMTCNWVVQVATVPKLVAVAVDAESVTTGLIAEGGSFSVSFVHRADRAVVRRFVKPVTDVEVDGDGRATSLQGEPVTEVSGGLPVLAGAPAWLVCAVRERLPLGSHDLFVGEVVDVGGMEAAGEVPEILRMEDTRMSYGG